MSQELISFFESLGFFLLFISFVILLFSKSDTDRRLSNLEKMHKMEDEDEKPL